MSSDDIVLSVKNVSKRFEMYDKPRHRLQQMLLGPFGKKYYREFWALRDINFEVHRGECVGVIGRNGAGKSTLLQIITGTLQPTSGEVAVHGRIAALLELGSGFNPEFTGRENVYMNAAILGLTKKETDDKFQEIVDFADIGEFIDQPVKTYSSGMMVRLAFAVNVTANSEILIVDEALAVGDVAFQKKCFQRIRNLRKAGCVILFVTHDMGAITEFCDRALLLENGKQLMLTDAKNVVEVYLARMKQNIYVDNNSPEVDIISARPSEIRISGNTTGIDIGNLKLRIGNQKAKMLLINLLDSTGLEPIPFVKSNEFFCIRVYVKAFDDIAEPCLCYRIDSAKGVQLTGSSTVYDGVALSPLRKGELIYYDLYLNLPLQKDTYSLALYLNNTVNGRVYVVDGLECVGFFEVVQGERPLPVYLFESCHRWHEPNKEALIQRSVCETQLPDGSQGFDIEIFGKHFYMQDHPFWKEFDSFWEEDSYRIFKRFIRKGDTVLDVGVWVGPTLIYSAEIGAGKIYAIEANPKTIDMLRKNISNSPLLRNRVSLFHYCICENTGDVSFGNQDGSEFISSASSIRGHGYTVPGINLHDFMQEHDLFDIPFIKIDIEGAEVFAEKAMRAVCAHRKSVVYLSMHPPFWSQYPEAFMTVLKEFEIFDSNMCSLSFEKLEARCKTLMQYPPWGTKFGNFFEVVLVPGKRDHNKG